RRVAVHVGQVGIEVARGARRLALDEALALPEPEGVVREAARAAVRPPGGIVLGPRPVLEHGHEVVVVVTARREPGGHHAAQAVALGAERRALRRVETVGAEHIVRSLPRPARSLAPRPREGPLALDVRSSRSVAPLAARPLVLPLAVVPQEGRVEPLPGTAHVALQAGPVPDLDRPLVRPLATHHP